MSEAEKHIAYIFERLAAYQKQVEKEAAKPKLVKKAKAEKKEK